MPQFCLTSCRPQSITFPYDVIANLHTHINKRDIWPCDPYCCQLTGLSSATSHWRYWGYKVQGIYLEDNNDWDEKTLDILLTIVIYIYTDGGTAHNNVSPRSWQLQRPRPNYSIRISGDLLPCWWNVLEILSC